MFSSSFRDVPQLLVICWLKRSSTRNVICSVDRTRITRRSDPNFDKISVDLCGPARTIPKINLKVCTSVGYRKQLFSVAYCWLPDVNGLLQDVFTAGVSDMGTTAFPLQAVTLILG